MPFDGACRGPAPLFARDAHAYGTFRLTRVGTGSDARLRACVSMSDPRNGAQSDMNDPGLIRLLLRHQADFMAYLMAMVHDLDAAEEIFQNAAVVVIQHDVAEPIRDFRAWAKEVVRRQALHYLRDRGRSARLLVTEPELLEQIDRAFDEAGALDDADAGLRQREIDALRECAGRLPEDQRAMVSMRYERRESFDAIGATLGRTGQAIQRALSRTRRALHDCVQSKLARAEGTP